MEDLQGDSESQDLPLSLPERTAPTRRQEEPEQRVMPSQLKQRRTRNPHSGCYVTKCRTSECSLRTHQQPPRAAMFDVSRLSHMSSRSQDRTEFVYELLPSPSFSDPIVDDPESRKLFYQYLSFDVPRIVALMAPPSSTQTPQQNIHNRQQETASLALRESVYFLQFVSMAHILQLVRCDQMQPNRVSAKLYGRLMQVLREKLDHYKPPEAALLVLCVFGLSSFDMSLGNHAAVNAHRAAVQQLVAQIGLPYLGGTLLYVMTWDNLTACFTRKPPLFVKTTDRKFLRPPKHPKKYGMGFELCKDKLQLDIDVDNLCFDICRAMEIVDAEKWTFRPERVYEPYNAADVQYLYFLRETIRNTCAHLQARDLQNPDTTRPILFAAMIVQYIVLGKNDLPWYSTTAADRLYETLKEQDLDRVWNNNEEILCWLMCLMATVKPWKQRTAALELFADWMEGRAGASYDHGEHKTWDGLCNPHHFVWSRSEFDDRLAAGLKDYKSSNTSITMTRVDDSLHNNPATIMISCSVW